MIKHFCQSHCYPLALYEASVILFSVVLLSHMLDSLYICVIYLHSSNTARIIELRQVSCLGPLFKQQGHQMC